MQEPIASAKTPSGRRRARLLAGTLALTMASFGAAVAITAAPAWASVTTNSYTIGTPGSAFTNVSATPTAATSGQSQAYVITMTAPSAIPNGDTITVTDSASNAVVATTVLTSVSLVDSVASNCLQSGGGSLASGALVVTLASTCNIAAGDTVKIGMTVTDPASNFSFSVASTVNGSTVASNTITINAIPPTTSASPVTVGYGATYTIAGLGTNPTFPWSSANLTVPAVTGTVFSISSLLVTSTVTGTPTTANSIGWYGSTNGAGYSVTYTPSGGSLTTASVQSATVSLDRRGDEQRGGCSPEFRDPGGVEHHPDGGGPQPLDRRCVPGHYRADVHLSGNEFADQFQPNRVMPCRSLNRAASPSGHR